MRRLLITLIPVLTALVVTGALAVTGSGIPPSLGQAGAAQARPNIVVIETDDQTLESMRVMDNVNSLIGGPGATFQNSFVNYSQCCPSRATFLTGQYMHNHRVLGNLAPNGGFDRFQSRYGNNNLAVWLRGAGYYTAMFGKYLNGYANRPPVPPGWSEWRAAAPDAQTQQVYGYTLNENGTLVNYGQAPTAFKQDVADRKGGQLRNRRAPFRGRSSSGSPTRLPTRPPTRARTLRGTARIRRSRRLATPTRSTPSRCPGPRTSTRPTSPTSRLDIRKRPRMNADQIADIQRKYRCQLESILSVDEGVRKIVAALRAKGELADTVLMYTSDNGYFHGEHRIPDAKAHIYEESIRVPLLMRGPGIPRGVRVNESRGQRRLGADDPRPGEREARRGDRRPPSGAGPVRGATLQSDSDQALRVRRARHGREGALAT